MRDVLYHQIYLKKKKKGHQNMQLYGRLCIGFIDTALFCFVPYVLGERCMLADKGSTITTKEFL